jgi:hypothetical protein
LFDLHQYVPAISSHTFQPGGGVGNQMDQDRQDSWQPISTAPFDQDIELAVIDRDGVHALVFPCRRAHGGWVRAQKREWVAVQPTHWRAWKER